MGIAELLKDNNRLIHAYDTLDPPIIWAIIKKHLGPLKEETLQKLSN